MHRMDVPRTSCDTSNDSFRGVERQANVHASRCKDVDETKCREARAKWGSCKQPAVVGRATVIGRMHNTTDVERMLPHGQRKDATGVVCIATSEPIDVVTIGYY